MTAADAGVDSPTPPSRRVGSARFFQTPRGRGFRALQAPAFRLIWAVLFIGQLGFWVSMISMQTLMSDLTDADPGWLGLLYFMNFSPMLVFTSFAGVLADRVDRKLVLAIGYGAAAAIMTTLAVLAAGDLLRPALLLPFAFAIGTVFAFTAPSNQAIVAATVPPGDLPSAISLVSVATNLSRVVGPALAAPVIAWGSEAVAFALYALASVIQVVILVRKVKVRPYQPEAWTPFIDRLKGGYVHARERPPMMTALGVVCLTSLFAGSYSAMLPVVAERTYDRGTGGFSTMVVAGGIGAMIGALSIASLDAHPSLRRGALLTFVFAAALGGFSLTTNWALALVLLAVAGGAYFAGMTVINTLVQMLADDNKRGRVMALFTIVWGGLIPIGGLWQGQVASGIGAVETIGLASAVTAATALFVALRPSSRSLPYRTAD